MSVTNGKELLATSIELLEKKQQGETGGNYAHFPITVVFMGEKTAQYKQYVKQTLDDNWYNADYLTYLHVVKSGDDWVCKSLFAEEEKEDTFSESLNCAIEFMLQQKEGVFGDRNFTKIDFILDATEDDAKDYYDLYMQCKTDINIGEMKAIYLMLDQRASEGKLAKSEETLQYAIKNSEGTGENKPTIFLVSNNLKNGLMLGENDIWKNYRLVSDMILLSGSADIPNRAVFYNSIKTLSYALVTKPIDEIAYVSLKSLMKQMYEMEEKNTRDSEMNDAKVKERFHINSANESAIAQQLFKDNIEIPRAENLQYLPFLDPKDIKRFKSGKVSGSREFDNITSGAWSSYLQHRYLDLANDYFENEGTEVNCRKAIDVAIMDGFSFLDLIYLKEHPDLMERVFDAEFSSKGGSGEGLEYLHSAAVSECKKEFYKTIQEWTREEFDKMFEAAANLKKYWDEYKKEIEKEHFQFKGDAEVLKMLYEGIVFRYITSKNTQAMQDHKTSPFAKVFNVTNSKEELGEALANEASRLFTDAIYALDFESELNKRIEKMEHNQNLQAFIATELEDVMAGSVRLKPYIDLSLMKNGCFYLINKEASYAKYLARKEEAGREFILFSLNRTDCVEEIEIFDIPDEKAKILTLVEQEKSTEQDGVSDDSHGEME